ncbi:MAG: hypothetical protein AAF621_02095 [Pseudomonadota bacterium]
MVNETTKHRALNAAATASMTAQTLRWKCGSSGRAQLREINKNISKVVEDLKNGNIDAKSALVQAKMAEKDAKEIYDKYIRFNPPVLENLLYKTAESIGKAAGGTAGRMANTTLDHEQGLRRAELDSYHNSNTSRNRAMEALALQLPAQNANLTALGMYVPGAFWPTSMVSGNYMAPSFGGGMPMQSPMAPDLNAFNPHFFGGMPGLGLGGGGFGVGGPLGIGDPFIANPLLSPQAGLLTPGLGGALGMYGQNMMQPYMPQFGGQGAHYMNGVQRGYPYPMPFANPAQMMPPQVAHPTGNMHLPFAHSYPVPNASPAQGTSFADLAMGNTPPHSGYQQAPRPGNMAESNTAFGEFYIPKVLNKDIDKIIAEFKKNKTVSGRLEAKNRLIDLINKNLSVIKPQDPSRGGLSYPEDEILADFILDQHSYNKELRRLSKAFEDIGADHNSSDDIEKFEKYVTKQSIDAYSKALKLINSEFGTSFKCLSDAFEQSRRNANIAPDKKYRVAEGVLKLIGVEKFHVGLHKEQFEVLDQLFMFNNEPIDEFAQKLEKCVNYSAYSTNVSHKLKSNDDKPCLVQRFTEDDFSYNPDDNVKGKQLIFGAMRNIEMIPDYLSELIGREEDFVKKQSVSIELAGVAEKGDGTWTGQIKVVDHGKNITKCYDLNKIRDEVIANQQLNSDLRYSLGKICESMRRVKGVRGWAFGVSKFRLHNLVKRLDSYENVATIPLSEFQRNRAVDMERRDVGRSISGGSPPIGGDARSVPVH